jgi:ATP-dependent exoDNAse (exonuclease V) alpha subunit
MPGAEEAGPKPVEQKVLVAGKWVYPSAFEEALSIMENTKKSVFITGRAGTGKSTLIEYFRKRNDETKKKKVVYLAFTGVAALNIRGGTIHSFFRFPPKIISKEIAINEAKNYGGEKRRLMKALDAIVVDEISMVRADLMDGMDTILRDCRDCDIPFGGVQMIFVGDLRQLPPVVKGKEKNVTFTEENGKESDKSERDYLQKIYNGRHFFDSEAVKKMELSYYELKKIFRQTDNAFITILNTIREGEADESVIAKLNERYIEDEKDLPHDIRMTLCTTNEVADAINDEKLDALPTKEYPYKAVLTKRIKEKEEKREKEMEEKRRQAELNGRAPPPEDDEEKRFPAPKLLRLKKGAQIMMVKNDREGRWVNGTMGIVKELTDDTIQVEIGGIPYFVEQEKWESVWYKFDVAKKKLTSEENGTFMQYPVKPAWAVTIHKSQGKTFEKINIDLSHPIFDHGQLYVALSRCTSLEGIAITGNPVSPADIRHQDPCVAMFETMMKNQPPPGGGGGAVTL